MESAGLEPATSHFFSGAACRFLAFGNRNAVLRRQARKKALGFALPLSYDPNSLNYITLFKKVNHIYCNKKPRLFRGFCYFTFQAQILCCLLRVCGRDRDRDDGGDGRKLLSMPPIYIEGTLFYGLIASYRKLLIRLPRKIPRSFR